MTARWQGFSLWLSHRLWLVGYWLEDKRIESAESKHLFAEGMCCFFLLCYRLVDRLARGVI